MGNIKKNELQNRLCRERLEGNPILQQEAVCSFILSCSGMAAYLRQMCRARMCHSHSVAELEDPAAMIQEAIGEQFRIYFGRELFPSDGEQDNKYRVDG